MRIILFGAGLRARRLLDYPLKDSNQIVMVVDNDSKKQGEYFCGHIVSSPSNINRSNYEVVLIGAAGGAYDIKKQLIDMGVPQKKIILSQGLESLEVAESDLDKIFDVPKKNNNEPFVKSPAVIYKVYHGETYKSHNRRKSEGFFEKYCKGEGLDIGYGSDPVLPNVSGWDFNNGDAQYLRTIEDESFDFVYSSHCLEHMHDVRVALKNWFRVLRRGGYLIVVVPHRDLYEKREMLPSRWNFDHRHMFLLGKSCLPDTLDIAVEIEQSLTNYSVVYMKVCDYGHTINDPLTHSDGEYQIEVVIKKNV